MQLSTIESALDRSTEKIQDALTLLNVPRTIIHAIDERYGQRVVSIDLNLDNLEVTRIQEVMTLLIDAVREYQNSRKIEREILAEINLAKY